MSMDLRSSSRSSRSRSQTPFSFLEEKVLKENHVEHSISKSTRKYTTTTIKTGNGKDTIDSTNEEYTLNSRYIKPSTRKIRATKIYKTSDYSSEGENEVSSTRSLSDNERNRILEDAKKAADTSSGITALGLYRRAKRYWDEYPKTDWTYSPFSKDRVEIAPGIVAMPNMSRRHISSYDKYTNTELQSSYLNNFSMRPQVLFSERTQQMERTSVVTFVKKIMFSILMLVVGVFYVSWKSVSFVYKSAHMVSLKFAKNIHRFSSRVMLMDTWLLRKRRHGGKAVSLMVLCLVPLLLLGGFHLYLVSGISVAPSCHPNCLKITRAYIFSDNFDYNDFYKIFQPYFLTLAASMCLFVMYLYRRQ